MRSLALLLAGSALACAAPPPAAPGDAPSRPVVRTSGQDYHVPERIGGFVLETLSDYGQAELGFGAKYRSPDAPEWSLDFFVFSARNLPPEISVADALWAQYEGTKAEIDAMLPQRRWKLELAAERALRVKTPAGEVDGVLASYQGEASGGTPLRSFAFLAVVGTDFVKMRATRVGPPDTASDAAVERAREDFLRDLVLRAERPPVAFAQHMSVGDDAPAECALLAQLGYGTVLEKLLRQGFFLHTLEREVALFEGALEFGTGHLADGAASECRLQPLADLRAIWKAGFLREYVWSSRRPSYWPDPGDLRVEEFAEFHRGELKGRRGITSFGVRFEFAEQPAAPAANSD